MEGVMMRGMKSYATAVRTSDGKITVESKRIEPPKAWSKIPILRGIISFFSSLVNGMKITMRSAEVFGEDIEKEEPSKFEKWLAKTFHTDVMNIAMFFGVFLGLAFSIALFFVLPTLITGWIKLDTIWINLIEGLVRIIIFISYILLTSLMKEIRRLYQYHGAEHKTIACFEQGLPLTVENARKQTKHHDRCGTNFIVIVMIISILMFSLVEYLLALCGFDISKLEVHSVVQKLIRIAIKLAMLPLIAGVSYEILKFLAKFDNPLVKILKAPGMLIQHITTREPDDSMLEVAIAAFTTVQELDADETKPTTTFILQKSLAKLREEMLSYMKDDAEKEAKTDYIIQEVTKIDRAKLAETKTIGDDNYAKCIELSKQVASGKSLQYLFGSAYFYGRSFKVNESVLIPRQDTEFVVEKALEYIGEDSAVLDLCTGSGCIAVTVALEKNITPTAVDIDEGALNVAKENAQNLSASVNFIQSDMFENIQDRYDVVISNPPYISAEDMEKLPKDVQNEPKLALFGGNDGLDYYRIIAKSCPLNDNGVIILEIGDKQAEQIKEIFANYSSVEIFKDLSGLDRIAVIKK